MKNRNFRNQQSASHEIKHDSLGMLALGALGVVYGDIGTSPLYAFRECFTHSGLDINPANVFGVLSLIFWALFLIISIKYVLFVLRADNKGEGGILSLMALALRSCGDGTKKKVYLTTLGLLGAALLYGDGVITPAISVLSAMEGLKYIAPTFDAYVIPATVFVITILFLFQKFGTGKIGIVFGPVMVIWFLLLGFLGLRQIIEYPEILKAINPLYAIEFFIDHKNFAFIVLSSVVLVLTGGEALYADMGHFGRKAIRLAWYFVAFPGLLLNYMGQGALLLQNPEAISNPFYLLAPQNMIVVLVVFSAVATVIASQALISGVFSITKQAVQLGFCPRMSIVHTSSREIGQIYIPFINWCLLAGVIWLVLSFKSTTELAAAYGIAVTGTMLITTFIAYNVARDLWKWKAFTAIAVFGTFGVIDLAFFTTNIAKIEEGGWVPLAIGAGVYLLMSTWQKGRKILAQRLKERSLPVEEFVQKLKTSPAQRVIGSAIYMASDTWGVPVPLLHNLKHNKVLHSQVAILTIKTKEVPFVRKQDRMFIEELAPGFFRIISYYGFMEIPKIKHILEACRERGIQFNIQETTFVLGRETILPTGGDVTLPIWRERIFALMARNAERPTSFFKIPPNQVIEVGIQVEI